ncbi:MAG: hypothetical protein WKF43_03610 [Acidimicrobiales bacterium]
MLLTACGVPLGGTASKLAAPGVKPVVAIAPASCAAPVAVRGTGVIRAIAAAAANTDTITTQLTATVLRTPHRRALRRNADP